MKEFFNKSFLLVLLLNSNALIHSEDTGSSKGSKVFLLVLDGFVHDYEKYSTSMPNFAKLAAEGVKADRMIPPFPTSTWPSMTTLNTGLYTESHGIINNEFYDLKTKKTFSFNGDPADFKNNGRYFTHEPLWLSNQKQGVGSSSIYYWPGYWAFREKPAYHNKHIVPEGANITTGQQAIDETLSNLADDEKLNFMAIYVDAPDEVGHSKGPRSTEYKELMEQIDRDILGYLMKKLEPHPEINLVVLADHGVQAIYPPEKSLYTLDNYLDSNTYITSDSCSTVCNLMPIFGHDVDELMKKLEPLSQTGNFKIYRKGGLNDDFPSNIHYSDNRNIMPILIVPDPGFLISFNATDRLLNLKGSHGYDPKHKSMSTIFLAKGPAFRKGVTMEAFESVHVMPLLAHVLGVEAKPNNGTWEVFKDVLNSTTHENNNSVTHSTFSSMNYLYIFIGSFVLIFIVFAVFYFLLMYCYAYFCKPNIKYVLVR